MTSLNKTCAFIKKLAVEKLENVRDFFSIYNVKYHKKDVHKNLSMTSETNKQVIDEMLLKDYM